MKTFKLDNEPKIESGFKIPEEDYFADFSARLMQQLPKEEPKSISIFLKKKTWFYAAAAALIIGFSIPIYTNITQLSPEIDQATLENYISYQTTITDTDLVNLLDEKDIKKISIDLHIDDKTIENELSEDAVLELYLLN